MAINDVLVIDDDPAVIELLEEALHLWGVPFTTGYDTTQAAERIIYTGERPRVVISDFDNRHASGDTRGGLTLYEQLRKAGMLPERYILISGYCKEQLPTLPDEMEFIPKPLHLRDLKKRIKEEKYEH